MSIGNHSFNVLQLLDRKLSEKLVKAGSYEGGHQIWECTNDLITYVCSESLPLSQCSLPTTVLDLGCGTGLLGIAAHKLLEKSGFNVNLVFQDMNEEVIKSSLVPTVMANSCGEKAHYVVSSWETMAQNLSTLLTPFQDNRKIILSSETLYNPDQYPHLCSIVRDLITGNDDIALFATKRYYFGVGGGTEQFKRYIEENTSQLFCEVIQSFEDGKSNTRDILKISKKKH